MAGRLVASLGVLGAMVGSSVALQGQACSAAGFSWVDVYNDPLPGAPTNCQTTRCYTPFIGPPSVSVAGSCDPKLEICLLNVDFPIHFPSNSLNTLTGINSFALVEELDSMGGVVSTCGNQGDPLDDDHGSARFTLSASCASGPTVHYLAATSCPCSLDPVTCTIAGLCTKRVTASHTVEASQTALCKQPPAPPCENCGACVGGSPPPPPPPGPTPPGKGGGSPSCGLPVGGGGAPACPAAGPGASLQYLAGGVGAPGFPGTTAWNPALGRFWSHEWAERIVTAPGNDHVWLLTREGGFREFTNTVADPDGLYEEVAPSDEYRQLFKVASGWEFRALDGTVQAFDASGRWTMTTDRNGNQSTATYNGSGQLTEVSFPDGRGETFAYHASGKLASIARRRVGGVTTIPAWTYTWSSQGDLVRVDRPDGTALELFYNDSRYPGYLTRIDEIAVGGGSRRVDAGFEYDAFGNAVRTWKGETLTDVSLRDVPGDDAVARYDLSFDDPTNPTVTTVTIQISSDPLIEEEVVYAFDRDSPSRRVRLQSISGGCHACGLTSDSSFDYDDPDHPLRATRIVDGAGTATDYELSAFGQVSRRIDGANIVGHPHLPRTTEWTYHPDFPALPTAKDGPFAGLSGTRYLEMQYGASGNLLRQEQSGVEATQPGGTFTFGTSYSNYNGAGLPGSIDPDGDGSADAIALTYNVPGRNGLLMDGRTDPLVGTTTYGYDAYNRRTSVVDPNGVEQQTTYDHMDRVTTVNHRGATSGEDLITRHFYSPFGDLFCTVLPRGNAVEYGYDEAGRLVQVLRGTAVASPSSTACLNAGLEREGVFYTLNSYGHRVLEEHRAAPGGQPFGSSAAATARSYLSRCELASQTRAPGFPEEATTTYAYDCAGNLEKVWDANHPSLGQTATPTQLYDYDALNRLVSVTEPWAPGGPGATAVTQYGYDVQDHLVAVTDANGNVTSYQYSDRDLLTQEVSPVSGTTTHGYDEHGALVTTTDGRGVTVTRSLDVAGRPLTIDRPGSEADDAFTWGSNPGTFSRGRLIGMSRGGSSIAYAYDRFGRLTHDGDLSYGYDANGNRTSIGHPDALNFTYTHDFADRELTVSARFGEGPPTTIVSAAGYAPSGPLTSLTFGNGLTETRSFDRRYVPAAIGVPGLLAWAYDTDGVGNPTTIDDAMPSNQDRTFGYQDVQYFLTSADGPWGTRGFTYDKIGNRLTHSRNGVTDVYSYVGTTPKLSQVAVGGGGGTRTYQHDAGGFLSEVEAGANEILFSWDGDGRLRRVFRPAGGDAADISLLYDARGFLRGHLPGGLLLMDDFELGAANCWSVVDGSAASTCSEAGRPPGPVYDSRGVLQVLGGNQHLVYFAGRPVAQANVGESATSWLFLTTDHLGTPILATTPGPSPTVHWSGGFEPFGEDWQAGGANDALEKGVFLRLPGQWASETWETATAGVELYQNVHRWYEVGAGRYVSPDPLGPASFSFSYAEGAPLRGLDPLGLFTVDASCQRCSPTRPFRSNPEMAPTLYDLVSNEVASFCASGLSSIQDVALRDCVRQSCRTGRVVCTSKGLCDPSDPDNIGNHGFSEGAGATWQRRIGLLPVNRTAYVCSNVDSNYIGAAGSTVMHEWIHGCGWDLDHFDDEPILNMPNPRIIFPPRPPAP
jgi:RHS repeat-associated protein